MSFVLAPLIHGGQIRGVFLTDTLPSSCSTYALLQDQGMLPLKPSAATPLSKSENFKAIRLPRVGSSQDFTELQLHSTVLLSAKKPLSASSSESSVTAGRKGPTFKQGELPHHTQGA